MDYDATEIEFPTELIFTCDFGREEIEEIKRCAGIRRKLVYLGKDGDHDYECDLKMDNWEIVGYRCSKCKNKMFLASLILRPWLNGLNHISHEGE